MIKLLTSTRQITKFRQGVDIKELPRESSFCHYTIEDDNLMIVKNAEHDPRFKDNPLVQHDPKIRFYAGMPLSGSAGYNLGALCVIDTVPRSLSEDQKQGLSLLANEVVARLELKKKENELQKQNQALEDAAIFFEKLFRHKG